MFGRMLIANRGEIALRIIRACHELGIETVCVFSEEDRGADYLTLADQTICIGGPAPRDSYLKSDRIIAAAEVARVDAIHPGYGFLAESAQFAEKCRACNIEFVGPTAEAMAQLGNKAEARKLAKKSKVPIVPGIEVLPENEEELLAEVGKIGFPLMIKAVAGGGGRGMRIVHSKGHFKAMLNQASQEALGAFSDATLYIEKFIENPRHVEVQIIADNHGNVRYLGERDCTVQRRYQKLMEESPSPAIDSRTRSSLCNYAVKLAKSASYSSAGTVEFLIDGKGKPYFIEVNARIQVEHPVTEETTGIDLISEQIRVAAGEEVSFSQRSIQPKGHAIECRINAEDPAEKFRPCPGLIERFRPPGGPGVRVDTHAYQGYRISPRYDSLLAKLIVHRATRDEAISTMRRCLREFEIAPIKTTIPFFLKVLEHEDFISGKFDTGFVVRAFENTA